MSQLNKALIFLLFGLVIVYGCSSQITFNKGVKKIGEIDGKYGASLKSPPATTDEIDGLIAELIGFSAAEDLPDSVESLIDFKLKFLEAEKLSVEGWQWGRGSTTDYGFGCKKGYARVTEAARLRNASAQKGYAAVELLERFVDNYTEEAKSINLTQKDVLVLKATYFQVEEKALRDAKIIESACGGKGYNKTLSV